MKSSYKIKWLRFAVSSYAQRYGLVVFLVGFVSGMKSHLSPDRLPNIRSRIFHSVHVAKMSTEQKVVPREYEYDPLS